MLELNRLTEPVRQMAEALAGRQGKLQSLVDQARRALETHAAVTEDLRARLSQAVAVDPSWRGAEPLEPRLDVYHPLPEPLPATLMASDGSQIYPDPHAAALYYLLNVGAIVLRQGSGQAPQVTTRSRLVFDEAELYDEVDRLVSTDQVNAQRDLWELELLAELAAQERERSAGSQPLVALSDGPLLLWMPQRLTDVEQARRVEMFAQALAALQRAGAVPLGYVDRPRSANVVRLLHLAELPADAITTAALRSNRFAGLSDRLLFRDLPAGHRTALFAATSEINRSYAAQGQRICFCYVNMAAGQADRPIIVRVEAPEWAATAPGRLDAALAAVRADCRLAGYPYVLARAHELAVVRRHEQEALDAMVQVEMIRHGLAPAPSDKQAQKGLVGQRR
ncbi:MAG: DNA double-strand break repair nuclease NurA [Anaerolineae bacterium]|nr:DNA double-strand break repair nuclease NurA [Anaerolineae bacterium]